MSDPYFSRTWEEASRKFRDAAGAAGARLVRLALPELEQRDKLSPHGPRSEVGAPLGIDVAVFEKRYVSTLRFDSAHCSMLFSSSRPILTPPSYFHFQTYGRSGSGSSSSRDDVAAPRKILLYTAGQHGVEGYAGSAILIDLCGRIKDSGWADALPDGAKIIFVHVMNPHGMREWRRWNENNVDINRNNGISQLEFMERAENPDPT